jgi:hypothetical protein
VQGGRYSCINCNLAWCASHAKEYGLVMDDVTQWVTSAYPPAVLIGSEYHNDTRAMDKALAKKGVVYEPIDSLVESGLKMPLCFVASGRKDKVARDAF